MQMNATIPGVFGLCLFALAVSKGDALEAERISFAPALTATPVVVFGADQRASVEQFAITRRLVPSISTSNTRFTRT